MEVTDIAAEKKKQALSELPASPIPAHASSLRLPVLPNAPSTPIPSPDVSPVEEDATTATSDTEEETRLRVSTLMPVIVFVLIYTGIIVVFALQKSAMLPLLERFTNWARGYGFIGYVCVTLLTLLTAIPPVPGYGLVAIMCGVIYGWMGIIPFYIGALSGAVLTFLFFRKFASGYAHRLQQENVRVAAVVRAVERRGFKLLFFIRCAPYPFSLLNAILAGSAKISFSAFFFATALTIPKLALNVGLGAHLGDIVEALFAHPTVGRWLALAGFAVVAVLVFVVVGYLALKEIRLLEKEGVVGRKRKKRVGPSKGEFI